VSAETIPLRPAVEDLPDQSGPDQPASPSLAVEPLLLTARQAAALYGISPATWHRWNAGGRVPACVRIGTTVRWRRSELAAHIEAGAPDRLAWERLKQQQNR
jgi:predicted DNA-binding transcriptional regulator AlpA